MGVSPPVVPVPGAVRVVAHAVVGEADDAQAVGVPVVYLFRPRDGVRALHAENHADGKVVVVCGLLPLFHVCGESLRRIENGSLVLRFQELVVCELSSCGGVGVLLGAVLAVRMAGLLYTHGNLDQGCRDTSLAHLRQGSHDAVVLPVEPAVEGSRSAGLFDGQSQIALRVDSADRHGIVAVDDESVCRHWFLASAMSLVAGSGPCRLKNRRKGTTKGQPCKSQGERTKQVPGPYGDRG